MASNDTAVIVALFQGVLVGVFAGAMLPEGPTLPDVRQLWLSAIACILALLLVAAALLFFSEPGRALLQVRGARRRPRRDGVLSPQ